MGRSRYLITDPSQPHLLTCTVLEWLPVFTRSDSVQILLDAWGHQRHHNGLRLHGWVVLENHLHFVAQAPRLDQCVAEFKSWTGSGVIDLLKQCGAVGLLDRLHFARRAHKRDREYEFWQEGSHAEQIVDERMMREKLEFIHLNPVKRGYVDRAEHWRYSSARDYSEVAGLIEIDRWF